MHLQENYIEYIISALIIISFTVFYNHWINRPIKKKIDKTFYRDNKRLLNKNKKYRLYHLLYYMNYVFLLVSLLLDFDVLPMEFHIIPIIIFGIILKYLKQYNEKNFKEIVKDRISNFDYVDSFDINSGINENIYSSISGYLDYEGYSSSDLFTGKYKENRFELADVVVTDYIIYKGRKRKVYLYKGAIFIGYLNKSINCNMQFIRNYKKYDCKRIDIGNEDLNKTFSIFCDETSEILLFRIFTPSFCIKLVSLLESYDVKFDIYIIDDMLIFSYCEYDLLFPKIGNTRLSIYNIYIVKTILEQSRELLEVFQKQIDELEL